MLAELFNAQNDVRECEESCAEGRSASGKVTRELTLQLGVTRYCLEGSKAQVASLEARLARCRCGQSKTTLDDGSDGDASEGNDWNDVEDEEDKNDDAGNGGNSGDDQDDDSDDAPAPDGAAIFDPSSTEDKDQPETSTANIDNAAQPQASVEDEVLASTPPASPLAASPTDSASSLGSLFASSSVSPRVSSPVSGSGPEGQAGVESATDPTGDIDPGTSSNGAGESVTGGSAYAPDAVPTRNWALVFGPTYAAEPEVKDEDEDEDDNDKTSALSTVPAANEPTISSPAESFVVVSPPESSPIATPEGQWNSLPVTPLALPSPLELDYSPECPPNSASASGVNANTPKRRTASGRAFKATKGHSDKTGGSASKTQKRSRELALRLNAQARLLHQGPTSPVTPEEVECLTSSMASFSIQDPDQDGPGDALMLEPPVEEDSEMSDADPPADEDSAMDDAEPPVKEDSDMEDADQDGPGSAYPPENVEMADVDERPSHHAPVFRDPNPFRGVMDLRTLPPCYHLPHDQEMTDIPSGMEEGDAGQPMDLGPDAATGAGIGPVSAFDLGSRQLPPKQKAKEETDIEDNDEGPDPRDPVAEMTARMNAAAQGARLAGERRETERLNQVLADADMGDAPLTPAEYRMLAAQAMRPRDEPEAQEQDQDTEGEGDSDNDMDADTDEDTTDSELDPDSEAAEAEYVAWRARALRAQRPPSPNRGGIGRRDEPEPELTANCDDDCPWECDENGFPIQDGFHGPKPKQKK